jgi:CRP/FNR family transcriptional regulator, cyclic AMP receptor protein
VVDRGRIDLIPRLAELPAAVKADLAEAFDEVGIPKGARIARQGDYAYELFAILQGIARVEHDGAVVAKLGEGELFGEIGLLLTGRRTAAIVAETPMRLLTLFEQSFRQLSKDHPEFSAVVHGSSQGRFASTTTG